MTVDPQRDRAKKPLLPELQGRTRVFVVVVLGTLGLAFAIGLVRWGMSLQVKRLELRSLGTIELSGAAQRSPIRDVLCFGLDDLGRIGFVRRSGRRVDFVRVDPDGQNLREVALPVTNGDTRWELGWSSGESWLAAGISEEESLQVWRVDVAGGQVLPLRDSAEGDLMQFAAMRDGGFLLQTLHRMDSNTAQVHLEVFDARGKMAFEGGKGRNPEPLSEADALAVRASGEIVAITVQGWLEVYSEGLEFRHRVNIAKAWDREPQGRVDIHAEPDDAVIVCEPDRSRVVRLDRSGRVVAEFEPHYGDGRAFPCVSGVQATPGGGLWTSDGQALLRLDATGVVAAVLGVPASPDELRTIGRIALGPGDRIHAVDPITRAVHVFSLEGLRLHVCRSEPDDFEFDDTRLSLSVEDGGKVLLDGLFFGGDGTRIGFGGWPEAGDSPRFLARRGAEGAWIIGARMLLLVAHDGTVVRRIERTPEGTSLLYLGPGAVAPDGSLALVKELGWPSQSLHLYTASGEPIRSLALPEQVASWEPFAYDGARLAFGVSEPGRPGSIVLLDTEGRELGRFTPPGETRTWIPYFAAGGRELWLFDTEFRIERYALP